MAALHADPAQTHDLAALGELACLSPWHFHRVYRRITGETPAATISRIRLHRAAMALARGRQPIGAIARAAGFSSIEAFTRAFGAGHGAPPARFRRASRKADAMPEIAVKSLAPMQLVATEHIGPPWLVGAAFDRLVAWLGSEGLIREDRLGVTLRLTRMEVPPAEQRTVAGLVMDPAGIAFPDGLFAAEVPGGVHAVAMHRGAYATLGQTWEALYRWIAEQGLVPADRPAFECNLNNPRFTAPADLLTEVCVPLVQPG